MPIYEYACLACGKRQDFLLLPGHEVELRCGRCGSLRLKRVVSRVRVRLSEEARLERLADPSRWSGIDEEDPRSVARFMKKMGAEMGEEFDEMVEELEEKGDLEEATGEE